MRRTIRAHAQCVRSSCSRQAVSDSEPLDASDLCGSHGTQRQRPGGQQSGRTMRPLTDDAMAHSESRSLNWSPRKDTGWSPIRELWDELSRQTHTLDWKRVDFSLSRTVRVPPHDTGVYLICTRPPERVLHKAKPYTVLYAGQVKSRARGLRTRFRDHIQRPSRKLSIFLDCYQPEVDFWYATTADPSKIDSLETLLIDLFNPPCNNISAPRASGLRIGFGSPRPIGTGAKPVSG